MAIISLHFSVLFLSISLFFYSGPPHLFCSPDSPDYLLEISSLSCQKSSNYGGTVLCICVCLPMRKSTPPSSKICVGNKFPHFLDDLDRSLRGYVPPSARWYVCVCEYVHRRAFGTCFTQILRRKIKKAFL